MRSVDLATPLLTVVVESVQMNVVGCVPQIDVGLTVRPALNDDTTSLRVERKERAVKVT